MRVLAAMSGGVDSAVAAARAVSAGHDVVGVHLALSAQSHRGTPPGPRAGTLRTGARGCCTVEDARDARRVADILGIPFYVWDFAERFTEDVVEDFIAEYAAGRTPNPCLKCNERIKFEALLDKALALGFDAVCTGHYASLSIVDGHPVLRRSADLDKDQSYVLASLTADQLRHAMFPLGSSVKSAVRAEAAARGLAVAEKPDSHDICFIPDGDTRGFLNRRLGDRPGTLVDNETGAILGVHAGVHGFTVGQRHGLGIDAPAPDGRPRYVLALEPVSATVRVGPSESLAIREITAHVPVWPSGTPLTGPLDCQAQVRAHATPVPAFASVTADTLTVHLRDSLRGVAPGQAVVLYHPDPTGDLVLASATIATTR